MFSFSRLVLSITTCSDGELIKAKYQDVLKYQLLRNKFASED